MSEETETQQLETLIHEAKLKRWERRKEMVGLYSEGYKLSDFVDEIAKKYSLTPAAVERDWGRRKKWMPVLAELDDPTFKVTEIVLRMRRVGEAAWTTYRMAKASKNHNAMVGAIEKLIRISVRETEMLQSLGVIRKEAEKIDAFVTTAGPMPWENIPEVKDALEAIRQKMRAEKAAEADGAAKP